MHVIWFEHEHEHQRHDWDKYITVSNVQPRRTYQIVTIFLHPFFISFCLKIDFLFFFIF